MTTGSERPFLPLRGRGVHELELERNGCNSKDDLRRGFISGTGRMLLAAIASMIMS